MLKKENQLETLKNKFVIKDLFKTGKRLKATNLQIVYKKITESKKLVLYCTDRKVQNSVTRNRVKRVLRAIAQSKREDFPLFYKIALVANLEFTKMPFENRVQILGSLLKSIHDK